MKEALKKILDESKHDIREVIDMLSGQYRMSGNPLDDQRTRQFEAFIEKLEELAR
jgi:hypothetical protein